MANRATDSETSFGPHKALRSRPRRRPRPRIRPRGVMECWSNGVLRQVRIAPRVRGVGDAKGAMLCNTRFQDHRDRGYESRRSIRSRPS